MGYGDYIPSGGNHAKKPLTKGQIKKMQKAFDQANIISDSVKTLEKEEQEKTQKSIENDLHLLL